MSARTTAHSRPKAAASAGERMPLAGTVAPISPRPGPLLTSSASLISWMTAAAGAMPEAHAYQNPTSSAFSAFPKAASASARIHSSVPARMRGPARAVSMQR